MLSKFDFKVLIPDYLKNSRHLLVCVLDLDGYVHFMGEEFSKAIGHQYNHISEINILDGLRENQTAKFLNMLEDILESPAKNFQLELHHHTFSANWEFSCLSNFDGDFAGILGIGIPDYELKSHKVYSSHLFGAINLKTDLICTVNMNWKITHSDGFTDDLFSSTSQNVLGLSIWEVFKISRIYSIALEFKKVKENNKAHIFEEYIPELGKWFKIIISPNETNLEILFKDITEHQVLTKELQQNFLTLQSVLEHATEAIFLVNKDLAIIGFNEQASILVSRYFQSTLKIEDKFLQYLLPGLEDRFLTDLENTYSGKTTVFEQEIFNAQSSSYVMCNHKLYPLFDLQDQVIGLVYSCKDIEYKRMELEQMQLKNQILRDAIQCQTFELRAPLASMMGLLDLLDSKQLDSENQKFVKFLQTLSRQMDHVIRSNSQKVNFLL